MDSKGFFKCVKHLRDELKFKVHIFKTKLSYNDVVMYNDKNDHWMFVFTNDRFKFTFTVYNKNKRSDFIYGCIYMKGFVEAYKQHVSHA